MAERGRSLLAINTAVLLFGTAGLFGKLLTVSPLLIVLGRVAFASLALVIYLLLKRERNTGLKEKSSLSPFPTRSMPKNHSAVQLWLMVIIIGVLLAVHWLTFFHSIQISTVAIGLLSFSTFPIYVALLEPVFFKEKLIPKYIILALISLLGIRLLIPNFELTDQTMQGVLWGTLSGMLFAALTMMNRKLAAHYPADMIALYQNFVAFLCLLPLSIKYLYQIAYLREIVMLIILGVVFTALSHTLFIYGLKALSARIASIIACLEPVYGISFAMLILSEIPEMRTVAGGVVIVGTVLYVSFTMKQNGKTYVGELYERNYPY